MPLCILGVSFLVHVLSHESHYSNVVSSSSLNKIYIKVHSQNCHIGTYILASVTFLLSVVLRQSLIYGSCVSLLEYLYSHSSHWNCWSFSFFWWAFIISKQIYWQIYLFSIIVFTLGTLMLVLSLNLNLHMVLLLGNNRYGMGSWPNNQGLNKSCFSPQDCFPKSSIIPLGCSQNPTP